MNENDILQPDFMLKYQTDLKSLIVKKNEQRKIKINKEKIVNQIMIKIY